MEQKLDNLQYSISKLTNQLVHQEEENPEDECLTETILGEQAQMQPKEELKVELVEAPPEELQDAPQFGIVYGPWKKEEQILPLLSEESNGKEIVEEPHKHVLQPIPTELNPTANAKTTYSPLPVYILPTPAENPKPTTPAPKAHASPSLLVQNIRKLMATSRAFSTTSKTRATAYIVWHSGWLGCRFGVGAPELWHF